MHSRAIRAPRCRLPVLAMVACAAIGGAAAQGNGAAPANGLAEFTKLAPAEQERVLTGLRGQLTASADPVLAGLLACAAHGKSPLAERARRLPPRSPKGGPRGEKLDDAVMPLRVCYVWGVGAIEPVDATPAGKVPAPVRAEDDKRQREAELRQALLGMIPRADAALAALEQRLDADPRGDQFAAFLHAWRNGEESFYEALDRTAGTEEAVFFFDAMLHDFTALFVPKDHADAAAVGKSLQARHDALHEAFLQYRRYRSFREAAAFALVLPPDVPFPPRLRRFEEATQGHYSVRQQMLMLRELFAGDSLAVAALIADTATRLPDPLWKPCEDPIVAWNRVFVARLPKMIEAAGDTDTLLARALTHTGDSSAAIAAAAKRSLAAAPRAPAR